MVWFFLGSICLGFLVLFGFVLLGFVVVVGVGWGFFCFVLILEHFRKLCMENVGPIYKCLIWWG